MRRISYHITEVAIHMKPEAYTVSHVDIGVWPNGLDTPVQVFKHLRVELVPVQDCIPLEVMESTATEALQAVEYCLQMHHRLTLSN